MRNYYRFNPYINNPFRDNISPYNCSNFRNTSIPNCQSLHSKEKNITPHVPSITKPPIPKKHPPKRKTFPFDKDFDFEILKKETCKSLNEVEFFLNNFNCFFKYIKLINLLK